MQEIYNTIINEDARNIESILPNNLSIQTTITSPPYYDMKNYGVDNQIGYGQAYEDYLNDLQLVFKSILTKTKEDGTLWIIIDTFKRNNSVILLPFDLAEKLKQIGWMLQEIIIWKKDKTVPWSSSGFTQKKFEYILFFSKSSKYKYNKDRVRIFDPRLLKRWWIKYPERYNPKGKALDEVWEFPIPVQGSWGKEYIRHFCPLPKEMVTTMIEISSDEQDIIFDPFAGTGSVLSQSAYMKRKFFGIEINSEYIAMFKDYLKSTINTGTQEYISLKNTDDQKNFENNILNLRALKYGRVLVNKLEKATNLSNIKVYISRLESQDSANKDIVSISICGLENTKENNLIIEDIVSNPPLSKFSIKPRIYYVDKIDSNNHFCYNKTNSYSYMRNFTNMDNVKVISNIQVDFKESDYE